MKKILGLSILFSVAIVLPALGDLSDADLNKIRLIIKEEVDPIKKDIAVLQGQLQGLEKRFDDFQKSVDSRFDNVNSRFDDINSRFDDIHSNNLTYALIALIVVAVGIPQIIIASRWRKDSQLEKQVQGLVAEIEMLKQQRIVQP